MNFDKVINGINKYLNNEIYSKMNDWQEMLARIAVSRMLGNTENLKTSLVENPFLKTFAIIDSTGNVDVDGLMKDIKDQIARKGKLTLSFPLIGKLTFTADDVDILHRTILEG